MNNEKIIGITSREDGEQLQYNAGYSDALASVNQVLYTLQQHVTELITKHPGNKMLEDVIIHLANSLMVIADCWQVCNENNNKILGELEKKMSIEYDKDTQSLAYENGKILIFDIKENEEE